MSDKLKTVREALAEQLAFMEEVAAPMSEKSWGYEEGVLLTGNEAKLILAALSSMKAEAHPKAQEEVELTKEEVELTDMDVWRIAREVVPPDTTNDGEPWYTDRQSALNIGANKAIRHLRSKYHLIPRKP